ncbi:DUF6702 family protein [Congregibacter variabilis]|uniref:DUF6702 family protein n=1 Tax=Congregibacter variabilis TaxID=3081200 RepID=A0ABZ0I0Z4_9GAMM|nr:DUF6702 family protein [Congregibacter sp. IMCC43200]
MLAKAPHLTGLAHLAVVLRWILSAALLLSTLPGYAHRGHAVWTDIVWAGESFEIVHRMHLADAIVVNRYMGGTEPIEETRSLARVALYVEERFELLGPANNDGPIRLETIGAEIEDDFLLIYQEWLTPLPEQFPVIDNFILLDVEPEAQAFIKIKAPGLDEERER